MHHNLEQGEACQLKMAEIDSRFLRTIEDVSRSIIERRTYRLKRFHPEINAEITKFIANCLQGMFPLVLDADGCEQADQMDFLHRCSFVSRVFLNLTNLLFYLGRCRDEAARIADDFLMRLPDVFAALEKDAFACYQKDPACVGVDEAILCYPGFRAIAIYRLAHELHLMGIEYLPRLLCEYAHRHTGIDIHPGAVIGKSFFIDHGTGVVIGETTVIGDGVVLYQNVTLGARKVEVGSSARPERSVKRHPSIGDNCVIYAGATILGGDTIVGKNSVIGANVWLTHSVPEGSVVKRTP